MGGAPTSVPHPDGDEAVESGGLTGGVNVVALAGKKLFEALSDDYPESLLPTVLAALERYPLGEIRPKQSYDDFRSAQTTQNPIPSDDVIRQRCKFYLLILTQQHFFSCIINNFFFSCIINIFFSFVSSTKKIFLLYH